MKVTNPFKQIDPLVVDGIQTRVAERTAGNTQIKARTIDLQQAAGAKDLWTATSQSVLVESLAFRLPNVNVADDATITSIKISTNDTTSKDFITAASGAKANLTAENQLVFTGSMLVKVGKKIQLTIAGGAADAPTVCDVVVRYRAVADGGYLA